MTIPSSHEVRKVTRAFQPHTTSSYLFIAVLLVALGAALWQFGAVGRLAEQNAVNLRIVRQATCPLVSISRDPHGTLCIAALKKVQAQQGQVIAKIATVAGQDAIRRVVCELARAHSITVSVKDCPA